MHTLIFLNIYYLHVKVNWLIFEDGTFMHVYSPILDKIPLFCLFSHKIIMLYRARMMVCILRGMLFMTTGMMQMGTTVSSSVLCTFFLSLPVYCSLLCCPFIHFLGFCYRAAYRFGELLDGRYEIIAAHGKGVFSTVVRAKDLKASKGDPEEVAIKIIRNNETM